MTKWWQIPTSWQRVRDIFYVEGLREPCWNCDNDTPFLDINFGARLCSVECQDAKWREFETAVAL